MIVWTAGLFKVTGHSLVDDKWVQIEILHSPMKQKHFDLGVMEPPSSVAFYGALLGYGGC